MLCWKFLSNVPEELVFLSRCSLRFQPPADRGIVMGTGIQDTVLFQVMRGVRAAGRITGKSKEEDSHARQIEPVHEVRDIRGNNAEIFCDKGKIDNPVFQDG